MSGGRTEAELIGEAESGGPSADLTGTTERWPVELRLKRAERVLEISFDDGAAFVLPAEYLRVESPSAEVQGHGPGQKVTVAGCADVEFAGAEAVGNYAIRLAFSDGHDSGIFSWRYLYDLGVTYQERWAAYLVALSEKGLSRTR